MKLIARILYGILTGFLLKKISPVLKKTGLVSALLIGASGSIIGGIIADAIFDNLIYHDSFKYYKFLIIVNFSILGIYAFNIYKERNE